MANKGNNFGERKRGFLELREHKPCFVPQERM